MLEHHKVDWYFHNWSVSPELYRTAPEIGEFYTVLATASDKED
jgi:hypothetical protein